MKVLALETATMTGSIAVVDDKRGLIAELSMNIKITHSERLMPTLDWVLRFSETTLDELDAFAVSIGPGSFTGLRIGLSTAKGLCYATGKPVVPVRTLDAFARSLPFCRHLICPMFDARRKQVYTALYKWEGYEMIKIVQESALQPDVFSQKIKEDTVFFGDGAIIYREMIQKATEGRIQTFFPPYSIMIPSASQVGEVALHLIKEGFFVDPIKVTPFYIRNSEAEDRWTK